MKLSVLASGSKGNCSYIETKEHHFLVDLGTTSLYAEKKLKELAIDPSSIEFIFVTHSHVDHIAGLRVFQKKYHPTIVTTEKIYLEIVKEFPIEQYILLEKKATFDDFEVDFFKTSHDTEESLGYIFTSQEKSIVYVTDTGYINQKYFKKLANKELYVFESNHDIEMLLNGSYPYPIKQRILGDRGHLSNKDSAYYLSNFIGDKTKTVILIHLSEENNREDLALESLHKALEKRSISFSNVVVAKQKEKTELVEI